MVIFPLNNKKAPAIPAGTNWQDYHGDVNTPLVGIMIPKGLLVLDIDTHKGCTTDQVDASLGIHLDWSDAELQTTMNGGMHYVFKVPMDSDIKNGTDLLGVKGFDTRASLKGYIATGRGYSNLTMLGSVQDAMGERDYWPELPEIALELFSVGRGAVSKESPNGDEVFDLEIAINNSPLEISQNDVENYLAKLPDSAAEDAGTWLKVGMAIYHQCAGEQWGWELFDKFSKRCSEKYDRDNNYKRWKSFGKNRGALANPITFASIIDMVGGRNAIQADKFDDMCNSVRDADNIDELKAVVIEVNKSNLDQVQSAIVVKELQKKFLEQVGQKFTEAQIKKIIKTSRKHKENEFYKDYVYLTSTAEYMCKLTKVTMPQRAFDVKHNRNTPPDNDGSPQNASTFVNNRIECVHSGMYAPMFDELFTYDGVEYFNTFKPNTLKRIPAGTTDIVDRIKGHIAHLLPKKEEQELVINYLAHNVQYQGKKLQWAIVLQGVQGDGKSFLAEMMKHVLGHTNCRTVTVESLDEKFTSWAEGNCMVFIEELKLDNYKKYETLNKLKPYIANPTVPIRRMQRDVYECINTTNYFALTNHKDALPIDDNDRRYCVLFSQWQSKDALEEWSNNGNQQYYSSLYDDMREHVGEILDWLMLHNIPDSFKALHRAPATEAKAMMLALNRSSDFDLVEDAIEEFKCSDINDHVVNVTKLIALATEDFNQHYAQFPKTKRINHILAEMGYHNIGRYKNKNRRNQTIYCKDDRRNAIEFAVGGNFDDDEVPF